MTAFASILDGRTPPGVYRLPAHVDTSELQREAEDAGWRFVRLDTSDVEDKPGFLDRAADAFGFPEWFGRNWDALVDSLGDVRSERGTLVVWDGWSRFARADERQFATALDILGERAESQRVGRFVVLLHGGDPNLAPDVLRYFPK